MNSKSCPLYYGKAIQQRKTHPGIKAARKDISISSLEKFCRYYGATLEEFFEGLEI